MDASMTLIFIIVFVALVFDFLNGFHDAANSIATVVSTRVLKPYLAVLWAAFFNFIAFLFFKLHVATTIGTGLIDPSAISLYVVLAALIGAILWNIVTWLYGLPSSSSHALIGGLLGAALAQPGVHTDVINMINLSKVLVSIVLSPLLGLMAGLLLMFITSRLFFKTPRQKAERTFRHLQLFSSALISLGHGGNDAQKTMGIIAIALFSAGKLGDTFYIPFWIVIVCNLTMALGTCSGGWRIVRTMGMKITKLQPVSGFCAETSSAFVLFLANYLGIPVSTTHTITGAIMGVGSIQRASAVRWGIAKKVVWAWLITIPASALVSAVALKVIFILK
jgi:inorganic phosphate transporter, PiT family